MAHGTGRAAHIRDAIKKVRRTYVSVEEIVSPMQAIVSSICVAVDDQVNEGDMLCLIEAMKMLTPIESPVTGKVLKIYVKERSSVAKNDKLLDVEY
jgi:biotin carboxyl carrier protein